jgi:hypothetical protein
MNDTMTQATIPLNEGRISVSDGVGGHYNWANTAEMGYRFIVRVGDYMLSEVVSEEDGISLAGETWEERIRYLVKESARWFGGEEKRIASRAAITDWINRDDPDEERLNAIEGSEHEHAIEKLVRRIPASSYIQRAVIDRLIEAHNAHSYTKPIKVVSA